MDYKKFLTKWSTLTTKVHDGSQVPNLEFKKEFSYPWILKKEYYYDQEAIKTPTI